MTLGPKVIWCIKAILDTFNIGLPGAPISKGGQAFSILSLLKGKIRSPITFKLNDLGTKVICGIRVIP